MDLVSRYFSVCVMMVCWPGPAHVSSIDEKCQCPQIPHLSLTKPPPTTCFGLNAEFRYVCKDGYVRKVGTSNFIMCEATEGPPSWNHPTLVCIPDPKIRRTTTTTTTATTTQQTMTTGKTMFTTQIMQSTSSAPEEGNLTKTTTHEIVTQSAGKSKMTQHTASPRVDDNSISPSISQPEHQKTTTVTTVSILLLAIICSIGIGIGILYKRKSNRKHNAVPTEEQP